MNAVTRLINLKTIDEARSKHQELRHLGEEVWPRFQQTE
jgi:hypothetical protein